jgi:hypothetical protein
MVDLAIVIQAWKHRVDSAEKAEVFRSYASLLLDAPYVWGSEGPEGTDCSGTVCFPLWLMGYNIRVSADVLYKELFTIKPKNEMDLSKIMAVFYITKVEKTHYDRIVPAGTATHVTPVVGHNVVLNAAETVTLDTAREVREYFEKHQSFAEWREMDMGKAKEMSDSLKYAWGVDPILTLARGMI